MNRYYMRFTGAVVVEAENEDDAFDLFESADYGISTLFDNTDDVELYSFEFKRNSLTEI